MELDFRVGDYVVKFEHTPLENIEVGSVCKVVSFLPDNESFDIEVHDLLRGFIDCEMSSAFALYKDGDLLERGISDDNSMYDIFLDEYL